MHGAPGQALLTGTRRAAAVTGWWLAKAGAGWVNGRVDGCSAKASRTPQARQNPD